MILTVEPVESLESIQNIFDELYISSEPYIELDNNPWSVYPPAEGEDKKTVFARRFFNPLKSEGVVIRVIIDGVTVSMFSGKVVEGIFTIYYSLYNDFNGSRTWLYDNTIMTEHLMSIREYFLTFGILGYKLDTIYNSTMYKYHKLNKPVLGLHSSITETTSESRPEIRTITYLF